MSQSSGTEANKLYVNSKGFLEIKNIRNQSEDSKSILNQVRYLEDQLKKLQSENDSLRQNATSHQRNYSQPNYEQNGTPRIGGGDIMVSDRSGNQH